MNATTNMTPSQINETAANLAFAWRGTDPMHSRADVRRAVDATGDVQAEDADAVTDALLPLLRRDGTLVDADAVTIRVDYENAAPEFWDFARSLSEDGLQQVVPAACVPILRSCRCNEVTVSKADAEEFRLWLATLGPMAYDGPAHARDPFVFSDE